MHLIALFVFSHSVGSVPRIDLCPSHGSLAYRLATQVASLLQGLPTECSDPLCRRRCPSFITHERSRIQRRIAIITPHQTSVARTIFASPGPANRATKSFHAKTVFQLSLPLRDVRCLHSQQRCLRRQLCNAHLDSPCPQ